MKVRLTAPPITTPLLSASLLWMLALVVSCTISYIYTYRQVFYTFHLICKGENWVRSFLLRGDTADRWATEHPESVPVWLHGLWRWGKGSGFLAGAPQPPQVPSSPLMSSLFFLLSERSVSSRYWLEAVRKEGRERPQTVLWLVTHPAKPAECVCVRDTDTRPSFPLQGLIFDITLSTHAFIDTWEFSDFALNIWGIFQDVRLDV